MKILFFLWNEFFANFENLLFEKNSSFSTKIASSSELIIVKLATLVLVIYSFLLCIFLSLSIYIYIRCSVFQKVLVLTFGRILFLQPKYLIAKKIRNIIQQISSRSDQQLLRYLKEFPWKLQLIAFETMRFNTFVTVFSFTKYNYYYYYNKALQLLKNHDLK